MTQPVQKQIRGNECVFMCNFERENKCTVMNEKHAQVIFIY